MLAAELAAVAVSAAPIATAWPLVRIRPYYRPLARILTANIAADIVALVLRQAWLADQSRPYTGIHRALFHVEQACGLVWPYGVAAVALVVLARRSPWPVLYVAGLALAVRVAAYPWLRQERLAWLLLAEQVALVGLCVWACWQLPKHTRTVERVSAPVLLEHHKAALGIVAIEASMLAGPHLLRFTNGLSSNPFGYWWLAQIGYSALFVGLSIMQWRWTWAARRLSML